jgi:adenine phosphoribosyltransferase
LAKLYYMHLKQHVSTIPDFPKTGITFRDISPLFRNHFTELIEQLALTFTDKELAKIDYIAGIEARGFAVGAALAFKLNKGFIPIRKQGKLPPTVARVAYDLEYGQDALEMHFGTGRVLLVDDVLATGGTLKAAAELCEITGHSIAGMLCIVDLAYLNSFSFKNVPVRSLITYNQP